jgi:hypothetical protein
MRANGLKGRMAYTNKITGVVNFFDTEPDLSVWTRGEPQKSEIA